MASKKEKEKPPTADEAEAKVLAYMVAQNRPYSSTDVFQNLHQTVPRAAINRALAALETQGHLSSKTYNKTVIYVARQTPREGENDGAEAAGLEEEAKTAAEAAKETEALAEEEKSLARQVAELRSGE
ncbi:Tat binding protein 1-interacting [Limtongia smithiae]|uniref:Tat binding protein 1-interacting n=1 Tax=Limtongia smithiae TaxID=1125753 RepID=UPI0034CD89B9